MSEQAYRIENDSLGEIKVPAEALYGAQTQRAVENFPISDLRFSRTFIRALGMIKGAAAAVNQDLGLMDAEMATAIQKAAQAGRTGSVYLVCGAVSAVDDEPPLRGVGQ